MPNGTDLRVVKTRDAIERSFVRLLGQKEFERITVQNILDEALVNRKTFYKHYEDKYNLADTVIEKLIERFNAALEKRFSQSDMSPDFPEALRAFYTTVFNDRDAMLALFKVRTPRHDLWDDLKVRLKELYLKSTFPHEPYPPELEMDYLAEVYASLVLSSIKWSLEHGSVEAIDTIAGACSKRMQSPAYALLGLPFDR